jgi:hypothetical protein
MDVAGARGVIVAVNPNPATAPMTLEFAGRQPRQVRLYTYTGGTGFALEQLAPGRRMVTRLTPLSISTIEVLTSPEG